MDECVITRKSQFTETPFRPRKKNQSSQCAGSHDLFFLLSPIVGLHFICMNFSCLNVARLNNEHLQCTLCVPSPPPCFRELLWKRGGFLSSCLLIFHGKSRSSVFCCAALSEPMKDWRRAYKRLRRLNVDSIGKQQSPGYVNGNYFESRRRWFTWRARSHAQKGFAREKKYSIKPLCGPIPAHPPPIKTRCPHK